MKLQRIREAWRRTRRVLAVHAIGLAVSILCLGCASPGYVGNRARDAADVFSAAVGVGAGAKARLGPIQVGVLGDLPKAGMRGGQLGAYGKNGEFLPATHDFQVLCFGSEGFAPGPNARHKAFQANSAFPFFHTLQPQYRRSVSYYTQIEVVVGIGGSLRLGFNPGELLDLLLGFALVDIFNDDTDTARDEGSEAGTR